MRALSFSIQKRRQQNKVSRPPTDWLYILHHCFHHASRARTSTFLAESSYGWKDHKLLWFLLRHTFPDLSGTNFALLERWKGFVYYTGFTVPETCQKWLKQGFHICVIKKCVDRRELTIISVRCHFILFLLPLQSRQYDSQLIELSVNLCAVRTSLLSYSSISVHKRGQNVVCQHHDRIDNHAVQQEFAGD